MYGNPCYHIVINNGSDPPGHSFIREGPSGDVLGGFGREFEDGDLAYGDLVSSLDQLIGASSGRSWTDIPMAGRR